MRLVTRSDFDGLACGALLVYLGIVDDWQFVHPKDIQDGLVEVTENDILANVPYSKGCNLWFDHHSSETERLRELPANGVSQPALSCARVIYDYYGGAQRLGRFAEMLDQVDRLDSAQLSLEDVKNPQGWILLGFIMDPRTGLGRHKNFTISNYALMKALARACIDKPIGEILNMPDVRERVAVYREQEKLFTEMAQKHSRVDGPVLITDLRGVDTIYAGNRFLIYALYPEQNISVWIIDGRNKMNCPITVGYSILNRSASVDVGKLLLRYGGGGHRQAGACQVEYAAAGRVIAEIIEALKNW